MLQNIYSRLGQIKPRWLAEASLQRIESSLRGPTNSFAQANISYSKRIQTTFYFHFQEFFLLSQFCRGAPVGAPGCEACCSQSFVHERQGEGVVLMNSG